jgi:hypothetical protein
VGAALLLGLSLAFPFVFHVMVPAIGFYWIFLYPIKKMDQAVFNFPLVGFSGEDQVTVLNF